MNERRTDDATLIAAVRILSRTTSEDGVIGACLAEAAKRLETLVEERRWVPVGERLPEDETWVELAGPWGESIGWHDEKGWHDIDEDEPCPSEITHWRKRGPGPEANG